MVKASDTGPFFTTSRDPDLQLEPLGSTGRNTKYPPAGPAEPPNPIMNRSKRRAPPAPPPTYQERETRGRKPENEDPEGNNDDQNDTSDSESTSSESSESSSSSSNSERSNKPSDRGYPRWGIPETPEPDYPRQEEPTSRRTSQDDPAPDYDFEEIVAVNRSQIQDEVLVAAPVVAVLQLSPGQDEYKAAKRDRRRRFKLNRKRKEEPILEVDENVSLNSKSDVIVIQGPVVTSQAEQVASSSHFQPVFAPVASTSAVQVLQAAPNEDPPGGPPGPMKAPGAPTMERSATPVSNFSCSQVGPGTIGPIGFNLAYVDFVPQCTDPAENIGDAKYETLKTLMIRANEWLGMNQLMKPVTLETMDIPCESNGDCDTEKAYHQIKKAGSWYIRVLRMWVTSKKQEEDQAAIEVRHINLFPKWTSTTKNGRPSMPNSEALDETIQRVNLDFSTSYPLSGKILCMETVCHLPAYHKEGTPVHLDPDMTIWRDAREHDLNFLTILRLYYIPGEAANEVIGVQDFVPELNDPRSFDSLEPFEELVRAAGKWKKRYKGLRITNLQTIGVLVETPGIGNVNTRKTLWRRRGNARSQYLKALRVYYTQNVARTADGPVAEPPNYVYYRNFFPPTINSGGKIKLEGGNMTMRKAAQKMISWVGVSGQELICVETCAHQRNGKKNFDPEDNMGNSIGEKDEMLFGFRVYTDYDGEDDRKSEMGSVSGNRSRNVSVASRDYSAWPDREIPRGFRINP